jgi:chromosome partitioning protein
MDTAIEVFFDRLLKGIEGSSPEDWLTKLATGIVLAFLVWLSERLFRSFKNHLWPRLNSVWDSSRRLQRGLGAVAADGPGLWLAPTIPIARPNGYLDSFRSCNPILFVGNLKGGVGKTTTAANLAAHYALKKNEKVLLIDLDFQGSLSKSALTEQHYRDLLVQQENGGLSKAAHLIDGKDAAWLVYCVDPIEHVPTGKIIPSYYSLASTENRVMVEWLLDKRTDDIRYHLATVLHDPKVQAQFDRIIIDAPPRLTTACIQGLCAATHVLIPTVLDELSAEAVGAFAGQLAVHQALWPQLKIVGAVGTMTEKNTGREGADESDRLADFEADALKSMEDALKEALLSAKTPLRDATPLPVRCFIPSKNELSREAGNRIAYAAPSKAQVFEEIRAAFDRLGDAIDKRIKS